MTGQVNDSCTYLEREYAIAGCEGAGLFDPAELGVLPVMLHTACWRGYIARYVVDGGRLVLAQLTLRTQDGRYPPLRGVEVALDEYGTAVYRGLRQPVPYSGKLLLAADFIQERYIHMGDQSPSSYRTVLELSFAEGALTGVQDLSAAMTQARAREDEQRAKGWPAPLAPPPQTD